MTPYQRLTALSFSILSYRNYLLQPLLLLLLLMMLRISSGCATIDIADKKPIDGYFTLQQVDFTAIDEDEVQIKLIYVCHNMNWLKGLVTDRIKTEFADMARENKMDPPVTTFNDSIGQTLVVADDFDQISAFFDNMLRRFNNIKKEYRIRVADAMLVARFKHDSENEKAEFHFSPFLFEPSGRICFRANNGNLQCKIQQDSSILRKYTLTDTYAEFLVENDPSDSLFRARRSQLNFSFSKPPDPWYSWASIKRFFAGDNGDEEPKKLSDTTKTIKGTTGAKPSKLRQAWDSTNEGLKWFAGVLLPILAFFGITRFWRRR